MTTSNKSPLTTINGVLLLLVIPNLDHLIIRKSKMEWISVKDKLPSKSQDGDVFYTFSHGEVKDYQWYSPFPRDCDGYGNRCDGMSFYAPNMDSDYGGEFKDDAVTHWMVKPVLPEPPKE